MTGGLGSIGARADCSLLIMSSWTSESPARTTYAMWTVRKYQPRGATGDHVVSTCSFKRIQRKPARTLLY